MSPEERQRLEAERVARFDPASYNPIAPRDFALLVRNPDAHKGEKIIIYGEVTQFDAATGTTEFRADTGAEPPDVNDSYTQNSYVSAATAPDPSSLLANVVEKDKLKMYVEVAGAYTYQTQIGGETTVPKFWVYILENLTAGQSHLRLRRVACRSDA
jgi:hypothetical protein